MRIFFYVIGFLFTFSVKAQRTTSIKGKISNYTDKNINIIVHNFPNNSEWNFYPQVDSSGYFEQDFVIDGYQYVSLNIGNVGKLFWHIREGDKLFLLMDYLLPDSSFYVNGLGDSKWKYLEKERIYLGDSNFTDSKLREHLQFPIQESAIKFDSAFAIPLNFLENERESILPEFYLLRKADLIGQKNKWILSAARRNNADIHTVKKLLEFYSVSPERQAISYEFLSFFDEWVSFNKEKTGFKSLSLTDDLQFIYNLFTTGVIERPMAELKLFQRLLGEIELGILTTEKEKAYDYFKTVVRTHTLLEKMKEKVEVKTRLRDGFFVDPPVLLGSKKTLPNWKKNNTLIYVYDSECLMCQEDLRVLSNIENAFEKKDKVEVITVFLEREPWIEPSDLDLYPKNQKTFLTNFNVQETPTILLYLANGELSGEYPLPSLDEGRALINALREKFSRTF